MRKIHKNRIAPLLKVPIASHGAMRYNKRVKRLESTFYIEGQKYV